MNIKKIITFVLAFTVILSAGSVTYDNKNLSVMNTIQISADNNTQKAKELLDLVNDYRKQNNLEPFKTCDIMNSMAYTRATEITEGEYLNRPDGSYYNTIFKENNIITTQFNQNAYWGGVGNDSSKQAFEEFKSNERQNKNMLSMSYNYIGIGVYEKDGKTYYYQLFCNTSSISEDNTQTTTVTTAPIVTTTTTTEVSVTTAPTETTTIDTTTSKEDIKEKYNLDVNKDGNIDIKDLLILKEYLLGMLTD